MKRVILAVLGTVAGLVALLDFKSHAGPGALAGGRLPSASVGGSTATAPATQPPSTAAPAPGSTSSAGARSAVGDAVQTQYGVVQVKVTVQGTKILNVAFVQLTADDDRSQRINQAAAPILLQETLSAQSAHVDAVSGASYTSAGYEQSLQSALDKAGVR
jgi:uncharacterized protein with FMN-binding domain